ncbi:MAG: hypothetical protein IT547_13120 [Hyphomonadaceae bacterium]|nr:hypothetical protein [Hyphomonadaceae bacterium]
MTKPADNKKPDYEVGYKQPPKHSRFKPGQSGCPDGGRETKRKKKLEAEQRRMREEKQKEESLVDIIARVARETIPVSVNGVRVDMPTTEVFVRKIIREALKDDADERRVRQCQALLSKAGMFEGQSTEQGGGLLVVYAPMAQQEWIEATEGKLLPEDPLHGIPGVEGMLGTPPVRRGVPND